MVHAVLLLLILHVSALSVYTSREMHGIRVVPLASVSTLGLHTVALSLSMSVRFPSAFPWLMVT